MKSNDCLPLKCLFYWCNLEFKNQVVTINIVQCKKSSVEWIKASLW